MARIRTVKPEFFRHHDLYLAEIEEKLPIRIAFEGLWTAADREGRFRWDADSLKLDCLPYDKLDFSRVLDVLSTRGFIEKYASNGRQYGWIPSFLKHQVINNRERASELPNPLDSIISTRGPRVSEMHVQVQVEGKGNDAWTGTEREGNHASLTRTVRSDSNESSEQTSEEIFTELPCKGKERIFPVTRSYIQEMKPIYPGVDIEKEILRSKGWLINNPTKGKTYLGMTRFLGRWFDKQQNIGHIPDTVGSSEVSVSSETSESVNKALGIRKEKGMDRW